MQEPGQCPGFSRIHEVTLPRSWHKRPSPCGGFTLVELIAVMIIIGILAAVAVPRFIGREVFDARGFSDEFLAAIQYARQQAVATRRNVCFTANAGGFSLTRGLAPGDGCNAAVNDPVSGAAYVANVPAGVVIAGVGATVLPATVVFSPLGQPNAAAGFRLQSEINCNVTVAADTGFTALAGC